jgi:hypothetical protein
MNLKPKQITSAVNSALASGFQINTDGDSAYLADKNYSWNDLVQLKNELGNSILEFVGQVNMIITNPDIINNLGAKKTHFERVVQVFFADVGAFSNKVATLRAEHEHLSGAVTDISQFNLYNRVAITYHSLFTELQTLVTPTLSDLVLTVSELNIPVAAAPEVPATPQ